MKYEWATWRIEIVKSAFVEVHVRGCENSSDLAEPSDMIRAAKILEDVARSLERVKARWFGLQ